MIFCFFSVTLKLRIYISNGKSITIEWNVSVFDSLRYLSAVIVAVSSQPGRNSINLWTNWQILLDYGRNPVPSTALFVHKFENNVDPFLVDGQEMHEDNDLDLVRDKNKQNGL